MLQRTDTPNAPWTVVEATHKRYVRTRVFETVLVAVQRELDRRTAAPKPRVEPWLTLPRRAVAEGWSWIASI